MSGMDTAVRKGLAGRGVLVVLLLAGAGLARMLVDRNVVTWAGAWMAFSVVLLVDACVVSLATVFEWRNGKNPPQGAAQKVAMSGFLLVPALASVVFAANLLG